MTDVCPVCSNPVSESDASCPSCGFRLLGSTQKFSPLEVSVEGEATAPCRAAHGTLRIVRGPQVGSTIELGERDMTIGRSPECDIFLNDMTVSREHAVITCASGGYRIADHNSFNGVWLNNNNVTEAALQPGDVIQIGAFCLLFEA